MRVFGTKFSRAFRVLWMLEELGETYEHLAVSPHDAGLREIYPAGKVPVLQDDNLTITDSTAILHYLADKSGRFTSPCGSRERVIQDSLTFLLLDEFDACLWAAARHSFVLPEEYRVGAIKPTLKWEFERSSKLLASRIPLEEFVMGHGLTVPDFILTHCLHWAKVAKFNLSEPSLIAYFDRMTARPCYQLVNSL